jgi:mannonate dehydratase
MKMKKLSPTWRWFGPQDAVTLAEIKQTGAEGVVTALHHIPCGDIWETTPILKRKKMIEAAGLKWAVVESVNIHESIKTGTAERDDMIANYCKSLENLAACGIHIVCYNFMPVLDWTRTLLQFAQPDGSHGLRYDAIALAAFDLFILKRPEAKEEFSESVQEKAAEYFKNLSVEEKSVLQNTIMAGLPGTDDVFTVEEFQQHLDIYKNIDHQQLKENLFYFLREIIPVAERLNIKMCIHPDDPPFSILGLPRIVSTEQDLLDLVKAVPSPANGITFCTGSLGANGENDLPGIVRRLGEHIHFIHLRNVQREKDGNFYEANHLGGSVPMTEVMKAIIEEQAKRNAKDSTVNIPMRPDHGHQFTFDADRKFYPGYSAIGRMRGLAELRGLEEGLRNHVID